MALPPIRNLPTPPYRGMDSVTFANTADTFLDALPGLATDVNTFIAALINLALQTFKVTSTTSRTIGTGDKVFASQAGAVFQPGHAVLITSRGAPTNFMRGRVTAYDVNSGALTVNVTTVFGEGTFADWDIALTVGEGAPLDSPQFTGTPTAPTAAQNTNTTQLATTAYVVRALAKYVLGTTKGQIPVIGDGNLLSGDLIPLLQANPNIGPTYLDWSYGSFVFSNISYVSKYGASGWCLSLNGVANDVPVVSAPLRAYPKGVDLVVSFIGWTNQGNATITNDLYPDDLPETTVILGTTPQRFSFVANSTSANMDNASLRFFWVGSTPGTTAFITDVKVEYGTRPTAYTRNDAGPGQFRANTPDRLLTTSVVWNDVQAVPFNDAPSMTLNFSAVVNAYTTLTGNRTLANPVNPKSGQSGYIVFTQDATGGRTLAFGSLWRFGGQTPILSTAPGARDILYYTVLQDGTVDAYLAKGR